MKLTAARRRGLEVIASREAEGQRAFRSNSTSASAGFVYWQTVDWLVEQELADLHGAGHYLVRLTDAGRKLASEELVIVVQR